MLSHKLCIALIATLITISFNSCQALNCATALAGTNPTACPADVTQCFIQTDAAGTVTRGCLAAGTTCTAPNCLQCNTDNCNANLLCKTCAATDVTCSTTDGKSVGSQMCTAATQQCRTELNADGTVTRGCNEPCATTAAGTCTGCTTDNCNVGFYPANRLQCYQCNSANCNTVAASSLAACPTYQADQKCYTIGANDAAMQRGCNTDAGNKCAGTTPDAACALCGTSGCNNRPYEQVLGNCYSCNDAAGCVGGQTGTAPACPPAPYTQTVNSCYTQQYANGTVQRGCTNELTSGCTAANGCTQCDGDTCNSNQNVFGCLICRSDNYAECRAGDDAVQPCVPNTGDNANICFEGEWDGVVLRGCLANAGPLMTYQCTNKDDNRCTTCNTSGCNKTPFSGASTLSHMGVGMMFGLIFIIKQYL
ncbi:uncharacterized protein LOC6562542 [Drosophila grimshawi]|uniref:GH11596 n=1 Tax=Drosophila grimshawi TaxID=7222 RepID=B4JBX2_DROGR|nr:uncharacterized protein LOC6562542 [Drosophila grimshawi]EDW04075.1 GH11596 [Drosophila grimshawi]